MDQRAAGQRRLEQDEFEQRLAEQRLAEQRLADKQFVEQRLAERIPGRTVTSRPAAARPAAAKRRSRLTPKRLVIMVVAIGLLAYGLVSASSPDPSVEPTVQAFLLAWEQGNYRTAASYTTGAPATVTDELRTAYRQLDAADIGLRMGRITQHGDSGEANFLASIDLGRSGAPWNYTGGFALRRIHSAWKIIWAPSVINPALKPGYRLAVVTTTPRRAPLLDDAGKPLARRTLVFVAGVRPDKLKSPHRTANGLAAVTDLDVNEVYGDILSAPSTHFFELATLRPQVYHKLRHKLAQVPGLIIKRARMRLFDSAASSVVGRIGTETSSVLRENGVPYRPGTTIGLTGLQAAFQRTLVGTPTTNVVAENAAGHKMAVLASWRGYDGKPVQTTIDAVTQAAAERAVRSQPVSSAVVAVQAATGKVLAVATHRAAHMPAVSGLTGNYRPGQAFSIVTTAGLIADGFDPTTRIPCMPSSPVGGRTFTNQPAVHGLGANPKFSSDFASACSTAFATLSLRLSKTELAAAAASFGLGEPWRLPVPAYTSSLVAPSDTADLAADSIGLGTVTASPLQMALVAGLVESGRWHEPALITPSGQQNLKPPPALSASALTALRQLMRQAVSSGAGQAAAISGEAIYGQVGNVSLGPGHPGLRASWFVGYRDGVAFAVLQLTHSASASAAPVARQFLQNLPAGS
jgi:cell division protein FtsI/penicillin-binding protein 2